MPDQVIGRKKRKEEWDDIPDIVRFKPDVHNRDRRDSAMLKHKFAEIPVTGYQYASGCHRMSQYRLVRGTRQCNSHPNDIMTRSCQSLRDGCTNIGIAQQIQAARA